MAGGGGWAKRGEGMIAHTDVWMLDLVTYCEREGVPFTVFEDWGSILETTKRI